MSARNTTDASSPKPAKEGRRGPFGRRRKPRDPNNPGRIAQFRQVFTMTRKHDPSAIWLMILAFVVVLLVAIGIGIWIDQVIYLSIIGIPLAFLAAIFILSRRAEKAAFSQIEGQPGATSAVLGSLRRGWYFDQEPVAAEAGGKMRGMRDMHNAAMVFRAVGRPGVVLISEGPKVAATRLALAEKRKTSRVIGKDIPVHIINVGKADDQVALSKLLKKLRSYDKSITKDEALAVQRRLRALGPTKAAVPAGVDPNRARADRRSMRGR